MRIDFSCPRGARDMRVAAVKGRFVPYMGGSAQELPSFLVGALWESSRFPHPLTNLELCYGRPYRKRETQPSEFSIE